MRASRIALIMDGHISQHEHATLIGQVLLAMGKITPDQLDTCLSIQAALKPEDRKPIGQIMLEMNFITPNDIIQAITAQIQMRAANRQYAR